MVAEKRHDRSIFFSFYFPSLLIPRFSPFAFRFRFSRAGLLHEQVVGVAWSLVSRFRFIRTRVYYRMA